MSNTKHSIKPFCVKTSDFTEQQIIGIVLLMVEAGIEVWDCVARPEHDHIGYSGRSYAWDKYKFWGYAGKFGTYAADNNLSFNENVLSSMEEVYSHLGIKQEKPTMNST